jgi:hypothetical protein
MKGFPEFISMILWKGVEVIVGNKLDNFHVVFMSICNYNILIPLYGYYIRIYQYM